MIAVWLVNRRQVAPATSSDLLIDGPFAVPVIGGLGIAAAVICVVLFAFPHTAIAIWPWTLTELTSRVTGAIFALGAGGIGIFFDRRWSSARILLQVAGFMLTLILIAVLRSTGEFDTGRPLTWVMGAGFVAMAVALAILYIRMSARAGTFSER